MKLLLFDIDGTLVNTDGAGRRALEAAIDAVTGLKRSLDGISLGGMTDLLIVEEVMRRAGRNVDELDRLTSAIFPLYLTELEAGLQRSPGYRVLDGVRALLERVSQSTRHAAALGTGNIEGGARLKLARGNLNHFFPTGGFGTDARQRDALLRAGVAKSEAHYGTPFETVWVIGDTPRDVAAAKAVGARSLAVASGLASRDALAAAAPDVLVADLTDVHAVTAALEL